MGRLAVTPGVMASVNVQEQGDALVRHASGDWGDVTADDWAENDEALTEGGRIFSVYRTASGLTFWIITEADRSSTTILLPEEY